MVNRPTTAELLQVGLKAAGLRQAVIANNIANLQTPGFRRKTVEFEKHLAEALESNRAGLSNVTMEIVQAGTSPVDGTGNDVSLDVEIGEMVKNVTRYKTYLRLLNKLYRQMELAVRTD